MGYRSEVAYVIAFEDKTTLNEFISLVMLKGGAEAEALKECQIVVQDNGRKECFINFYADDVKWYDSYAEVEAHTWLYQYAVERFEDKCAYKFLRIGEEQGDIEDDHSDPSDKFDLYQDFYTRAIMEIPFEPSYKPVGDALRVIE
jgi:hypothetical protein